MSLSPRRVRTLRALRPSFDAAVRSRLGLTFRDVQYNAAAHLTHRRIVEMHTGEGKTLTTALAAAAYAKSHRQVFVATANEYLANRDAAWMRPILGDLAITVGSACAASATQRSQAYKCDITYGTIRQFGFDFLRDGIQSRRRGPQRGEDPAISATVTKPLDVLIIDEADSVLIDEARTPMIIHSMGDRISAAHESLFRWSAEVARSLAEADFAYAESGNYVALTSSGRAKVLAMRMPPSMNVLTTTEILHAVERAILAQFRFRRDHHYLVRDGKIDLVDEFTGRVSAERTMANGIHQAIEAKEGLPLKRITDSMARITIQGFVAKFDHVCGLTATAHEDRHELGDVYRLSIRRIPTHRRVQRTLMPTVTCANRTDKWNRIATEAEELCRTGRAVLIGTRTVRHSESLGAVLDQRGIAHQRLSALNPEQESKIVSIAGEPGRVTIATNMAGRGTDIPLAEGVRSRGGLHVIVSELHAAGRIDRQLMGRCARQGDPGSARIYVSADDEMLALAWGADVGRAIQAKFNAYRGGRWLTRRMRAAQRCLENRHRRQRFELTAHESRLADSMRVLGIDPNFDPVSDAL